jgi:hypothetical protein
MLRLSTIFPVTALLLATGCTTLPTGPDVLVLPGTGRSFEQFSSDDATCESYAGSQVGSQSSGSTEQLQMRYDAAYVQCMYGKGHRVPVSGPFSDVVPHKAVTPDADTPPPPEGAPPPPPGSSSTEPMK